MNRKRMQRIGLISAVPFEAGLFLSLMRGRRTRSLGCLAAETGRICEREIVYASSGIGKANAAHAASVLIHKYRMSLVVCFGIGGAYPGAGLKPGDLAVASEEIYADEGVLTKEGFRDLELIGIPSMKRGRLCYYNVFPLDRRLAGKALASSEEVAGAKSGTFLTVSTSTGVRSRAVELEDAYGAVCENMEGAAIAHVCAMHDIPLVEIRGISNIVEDRDISKWEMRTASENCQKAVAGFIGIL